MVAYKQIGDGTGIYAVINKSSRELPTLVRDTVKERVFGRRCQNSHLTLNADDVEP